DGADRPLTGAKPPPARPGAVVAEDRPLSGGAGGKGAWVPPSEFPPGHESEVAKPAAAVGGVAGEKDGASPSSGGAVEEDGGEKGFMTALGLLKIREEADPFSMDIGVLRKGDIVKVLETSSTPWVRVSYHGREGGWVLTANKRGPTLVPADDANSAAEEFDAQEAAFAAAAAAPVSGDGADRPLTGAKPPPARPGAVVAEDRPLSGGAGGKGAWVPPSEFPPGHESGGAVGGGAGEAGGDGPASGGAAEEDGGEKGFMTALGLLKIREEADPFSMDIGVLKKGDIVKVLETSSTPWVRVCYHGREDGWVLAANKRGPTLVPAEDANSAAEEFDAQEAAFAAAATAAPVASDGADRPLTGAKPPPVSSDAVVAEDRPLTGGGGGGGGNRSMLSNVSAFDLQDGSGELEAVPGGGSGGGGGGGGGDVDGLASTSGVEPAAAVKAKPWARRKKFTQARAAAAKKGADSAAEGATEDGKEEVVEAKPWLKKRKPVISRTAAAAVADAGEGEGGGGVVVKPWQKAAAVAVVTGGGEEGAGAGGEGGVKGLEACLKERDWKKRVAAFEDASRACRSGDQDAVGTVGPLLPRMLQDNNVQAVDAAVETLKAYLSSRSTMGAEEGAALSSALAERALCCGRGPVEAKGVSAAEALLEGEAGELAQRGAWLVLAARAGSLENRFFPPPLGEDGERARSRVMVAAAAPKAVEGCVKAMSAALGKPREAGRGDALAGGEEARKEVYLAAKSLLSSSKLPIKMAGVSLATALYTAEGDGAKKALGMEDMEHRIKALVRS
ncbi:unnamed protein product, partial [Laminaria digitata]